MNEATMVPRSAPVFTLESIDTQSEAFQALPGWAQSLGHELAADLRATREEAAMYEMAHAAEHKARLLTLVDYEAASAQRDVYLVEMERLRANIGELQELLRDAKSDGAHYRSMYDTAREKCVGPSTFDGCAALIAICGGVAEEIVNGAFDFDDHDDELRDALRDKGFGRREYRCTLTYYVEARDHDDAREELQSMGVRVADASDVDIEESES